MRSPCETKESIDPKLMSSVAAFRGRLIGRAILLFLPPSTRVHSGGMLESERRQPACKEAEEVAEEKIGVTEGTGYK